MRTIYLIAVVCITLCSVVLTSCKDYKEEHYGQFDGSQPSAPIMEQIREVSELKQFCELIAGSEIESLLSRPTAYTLFIPSSKVLSESSMSTDKLISILPYYITNGYFPSKKLKQQSRIQTVFSTMSEYEGKKIGVKDYKFLNIASVDNGVKVNEIDVIDEFLLEGGVVYIIDQMLEPSASVWEYISENKATHSMIYDHFKSAENIEMDMENSIRIGFDEFGNDIYDAVYTISNSEFDRVGRLISEREYFTCGVFSDQVYSQATSSLSSYNELPEDVKAKILGDAISMYFFRDRQPELPFTAANTSGDRVEMKSDFFASKSHVSNGLIYNFAENKLKIDFERYFNSTLIELKKLTSFSDVSNNTWLNYDGFVGGAVIQPQTNVTHKLSDNRTIEVRRLAHKVGNGANRIPFGVYVKKSDVLPVPYKVRWKIANIGTWIDKYNWIYFKEFAVNPANCTVQYSLVNAIDNRDKAKNLNIRIYDADNELLYTQSDIIVNAQIKDGGQAIPFPVVNIRNSNPELYARIKSCQELYIEYDWSFDSDRVLGGRSILGMVVELNGGSTASGIIHIDIDNIELIPQVK